MLAGTLATSDDEWMSTMVFEKIAEGDVAFLLTGEGDGNVFSIQAIDIMDDVEFGPPIGDGTEGWLLVENDEPGPGDDGNPGGGGGDNGEPTGGGDDNEEPTGGGGGGTGGNTGTNGGGPVGAVPEPTAALLFGVGAVVFARRRSRRGR